MASRKKTTSSTLTKLAKELAAIPAEEVAPPSIPVDRLIGEARTLAKVAEKHLDALAKVGLDRKLAASLDVRADALSEAQSAFLGLRGKARSDDEIAFERQGVALRADMVADLRFAARAKADVQAQVDAIQEGEGLDDLVQDLRDLSALFAPNAALLKKASVDAKAKVASAKKLGQSLEKLVATRRAISGTGDDAEAKDLRDRAAVHLEHAMREVRAAGVYAFRDKPATQSKFRSAYAAARRTRAATRRKTAPAPAPDAG